MVLTFIKEDFKRLIFISSATVNVYLKPLLKRFKVEAENAFIETFFSNVNKPLNGFILNV